MQPYKKLTMTELASTNNINSHPCIGYNIKCFPSYQDRDGAVKPVEFDAMIEVAAASPRRFGRAPKSGSRYKSVEERVESKRAFFDFIDGNLDGKISFNEWLEYIFFHLEKRMSIY